MNSFGIFTDFNTFSTTANIFFNKIKTLLSKLCDSKSDSISDLTRRDQLLLTLAILVSAAKESESDLRINWAHNEEIPFKNNYKLSLNLTINTQPQETITHAFNIKNMTLIDFINRFFSEAWPKSDKNYSFLYDLLTSNIDDFSRLTGKKNKNKRRKINSSFQTNPPNDLPENSNIQATFFSVFSPKESSPKEKAISLLDDFQINSDTLFLFSFDEEPKLLRNNRIYCSKTQAGDFNFYFLPEEILFSIGNCRCFTISDNTINNLPRKLLIGFRRCINDISLVSKTKFGMTLNATTEVFQPKTNETWTTLELLKALLNLERSYQSWSIQKASSP